MLTGYRIIAVPKGTVTNEMTLIARKKEHKIKACPCCGNENHDTDAWFCKYCG